MSEVITSTPCANIKKRELSSPIDLLDLKKNRIGSESDSDTSSILINPTMTNITLSQADISNIASVLDSTFETKVESQLESMVKKIISGVIDGFRDEIATLRNENKQLKTRVDRLELAADTAEQYSRRNCLRISGIPESDTEDTDRLVLDMADAIGASIAIDDIDRSHRVGRPPTAAVDATPRAIIVKFTSYRYRQKLFGALKMAKDRGYDGVFINEDLTRYRNGLLYMARKLVKTKCLLGAWSADGNILIRDGSKKVHRVANASDLDPFNTPITV